MIRGDHLRFFVFERCFKLSMYDRLLACRGGTQLSWLSLEVPVWKGLDRLTVCRTVLIQHAFVRAFLVQYGHELTRVLRAKLKRLPRDRIAGDLAIQRVVQDRDQ